MEFFKAVNVDPLDIVTLIFAWKIKAKVPCEFSNTEFVEGCLSLNCDTLPKLKRVIRTFPPANNSGLLMHFSNPFCTRPQLLSAIS